MELIKANQAITTNTRKTILDNGYVLSKIADKDLIIAKLGAKKIIKEIPETLEENGKQIGLVHLSGIVAKDICRDYGIRNVEQAQVFRFYTTIRDYYNHLTIEEIRVAFELALVGELDMFLPRDSQGNPDKQAYQNFSQEFICKILNAYKKYRQKVWGKVYTLALEEPKEISEEEKNFHKTGFKQVIREQYELWRSGAVPVFMFAQYVAKYLIEQGLAEDMEIKLSHRTKAFQMLSSERLGEEERGRLKKAFTNNSSYLKLDALAERIKNDQIILLAFEEMKKSENK